MSVAAKGLGVSYEKLGEENEALFYFKLHAAQHDSLFNLSRLRHLSMIETVFEIEQKDNAIRMLERDKRVNNMQLLALGLGLLLLIVIGLLMITNHKNEISSFRELNDKNQQLHRQSEALTAAKLKNANLEHSRLQHELDYKNQELMNFALHIVQKNQFLLLINSKHIL